ncbi:MAG: FAD-dependent oxidoreductase, partial [Chloroflexi bacterium]|nr:FAD-dependent oxidoreductase [Chloroflexota bacterium]
TPMQTWDRGTRRIYENLSANFRDKIYLNRPVRKVYRLGSGVVVEDEDGVRETFDEVIFACNANQTLMMLDRPTALELFILTSIRYASELHNHAVV